MYVSSYHLIYVSTNHLSNLYKFILPSIHPSLHLETRIYTLTEENLQSLLHPGGVIKYEIPNALGSSGLYAIVDKNVKGGRGLRFQR